jgi:membrane-bound metal-dependent hydrolase YbcI (DUF457 family)
MPSPLGHTLAGLTIGWLSDRPAAAPRGRWAALRSPLVIGCASAAALPDADLLISEFHRKGTHSIVATVLIFIIASVVTGKVTPSRGWRVAFALAAAQSTHLLLDWLGTDGFPPPGIQALWPFSHRFFVSGIDLFPPVERLILTPGAFSTNLRAAMWELLIVGPPAAISWLIWRYRALRVAPAGRRESRGR